MALQQTGKTKAARVPLGYYRFLGLGRKTWAWGIAGGLLALAAGAVALGYWKQAVSPGPIHSAHARWENDCSTCHAPFTPTGSGNGLNSVFFSRGKPADALCQRCHMGHEAQEHHKSQIASEVESCASCHKDHRGRSAFISRVSDAKCTSCHADLNKHVEGGKTEYHPTITSFARDHAPFWVTSAGGERVELGKAKDPGNLRFNHKLHLAAGLDVGWKYDQIPEKDGMRERYVKMQEKQTGEAVTAGSEIKLDCSSCHVLTSSDEPGHKNKTRQSGDYVLPVTYEQHCKACHPLTFSSKAGLKDVEIPHHLQPAEVRDFLTGAFARVLVKEGAKGKKASDTPLPGQDPDEPKVSEQLRGEAEKGVRFLFQEQAAKAGRDSNCRVCHTTAAGKGGAGSERIVPPNVPQVWYEHARFSHQAHRTMECAGCHAGAREWTKKDDVLLPGKDNCVRCHAPARTVNGAKQGGVRHECVTCHNYHHGDAPLAGRGSEARGVKQRVDLDEWLSDKFGKK